MWVGKGGKIEKEALVPVMTVSMNEQGKYCCNNVSIALLIMYKAIEHSILMQVILSVEPCATGDLTYSESRPLNLIHGGRKCSPYPASAEGPSYLLVLPCQGDTAHLVSIQHNPAVRIHIIADTKRRS